MVQITVNPSVTSVRVGQTFTYTVEVTPDVPIAGGQVNFRFNPAAMKVNSVTKGPFFGTIPDMFNPGVIDNAAGVVKDIWDVAVGAGNAQPDKAVFVTFSCTALKAGEPSGVTLESVVMGDKAAQPRPFELAVSQVVFLPFYDLNGDGVVNQADIVLAALQFGKDGTADFNDDGIVNVLDLVLIGQNFT